MGLQLLIFYIIVLITEVLAANREHSPSYDQNYVTAFGAPNVLPLHQGRDAQLSLTRSTGSGILSKLSYSSGFFHLNINLPGRDFGGVVTAFYMKSNNNDELDFEFLGNREGNPYAVQTNVFTNGKGGREHRIHLWFDPTASFHIYRILWNPHQVVFFVDEVPIRIFKNNRGIRVGYPDQPMQIEASIWDGDSWATDGGKTKVNWTHAPFEANLRSFGIDGCPSNTYPRESCYSSKWWWNRKQYWKLSPDQERKYQTIKHKFVTYDY